MRALKSIIIILTPFIISFVDILNGVMLYVQYYKDFSIDNRIYQIISHSTGSSVLLIYYILIRSTHMCVYYKSACWMILSMHLVTIMYYLTSLRLLHYIYIIWIMSSISLISWTISILVRKTYKTINQACTREQRL